MPEEKKESKIPMGFGLSGYDFMKKSDSSSSINLATSGGRFGQTADAIWGGGLIDDRWVEDEKYKQVQIQTSIYQSCPLIYNGTYNGIQGNIYGELTDKPHQRDHNTDTGGGAFTGCNAGGVGARLFKEDVVGYTANNMSPKLTRWHNNLLNSKKKGRTDFYMGGAMSPHTLVAYFAHFYNINTNYNQVKTLLHTLTVCAEVVYRLSNTSAKAWRIKIMDSSGPTRGQKGTTNANGSEVFDYDVLDICMGITLTKMFEQFCTYGKPKQSGGSKRWKQLNTGELMFPWHDQAYNYKDASIPGYGPTGIAKQNIVAWDASAIIDPVASGIWHTMGGTPHGGLPIARARYFADPEDASTVRSVFPNMPDDFFVTNFSDGGDADWTTGAIDFSQFKTISERIARVANKLAGLIVAERRFEYSSQTNPVFVLTGHHETPMYTSTNNYINCDAFVHWVLLESQLTLDLTDLMGIRASEWTAGFVQKYLISGFKAIDLEKNISAAEPGDILVFGEGGSHHCSILSKKTGAQSWEEYGMGTQINVEGKRGISHWSYGMDKLRRIIKIVQENQDSTS